MITKYTLDDVKNTSLVELINPLSNKSFPSFQCGSIDEDDTYCTTVSINKREMQSFISEFLIKEPTICNLWMRANSGEYEHMLLSQDSATCFMELDTDTYHRFKIAAVRITQLGIMHSVLGAPNNIYLLEGSGISLTLSIDDWKDYLARLANVDSSTYDIVFYSFLKSAAAMDVNKILSTHGAGSNLLVKFSNSDINNLLNIDKE